MRRAGAANLPRITLAVVTIRFAGILILAAAAAMPAADEGWKPLFDGTSLQGWNETPFAGRGKVEVADGVIVLGAGSITGINWTGPYPQTDYEERDDLRRGVGVDIIRGIALI